MKLSEFLTGIANAIRYVEGSTQPIPAPDYATRIRAFAGAGGGGGGEVIEPVLMALEVTQNGVYVPGAGVDGFNSVVVKVPSAGIENGIGVNAVDASGNWIDITIYGEVPATMFKGNTKLQRVTLVGAKTIPANAFNGCTALISIAIPDGVTSIGNHAFYNCQSLTSIRIPEGVTSIEQYTFRNCISLKDVTLPSTLKTIANDAFHTLTSLTSITIPANIISIGAAAFHGCTNLTDVYWDAVACTSCGSGTYPAFGNCGVRNFVIADNVQSLPAYLLHKNAYLESIIIPDSVATINAYAFGSCTALLSVQIGTTGGCAIASINANTFKASTALIEIIIYAETDAVSGSPWGATNATVTWAIDAEIEE